MSLETMLSVTGLSIGVALLSSLTYKYGVNQDIFKNMKLRTEELKKSAELAQKNNDHKEMEKHQQEMLNIAGQQMKMMMKPMVMSLVFLMPIFIWVGPALYGTAHVVELPFPILGATGLDWFWWYLIVSIPFTTLFRKLFGVA